MEIRGRVIKYGDHVNTDLIIPGKYLVFTDPEKLAEYAMKGLDPEFFMKLEKRKIILAGKHFGCGSSREQAPIAIKYAGVKCVLAESFARIFYRNAVNIGLPVLECPGVTAKIADNDDVAINLGKGIIKDFTLGAQFQAIPVPDFLLLIMQKGLVEYIRMKKAREI